MLGADEETALFDPIDSVGFSPAIPGLLHYDITRDDPAMHPALSSLEKSKTLPMPFIRTGNPATVLEHRYRTYVSHTAARRRVPGPRATSCVLPSDTLRPELYVPCCQRR